uniref:Uncharacterized protein n=1 Tax=viral metagenome TaxID=1070528 RepID=A0A6H1ZMS0_9ZZZZ
MKIWPVEIEGWKPKAERLQAELDRVPAVQEDARARAAAAKAATENTYRAIAQEIDDHAEDETRRELAAADRYVAAHRLRTEADPDRGGRAAAGAGDRSSGDGQATGRTPQLDDAGSADSFAADPGSLDGLVAVSAQDVRICTINTLQAEAAQRWAIGLEAASRDQVAAVPIPRAAKR